MTDPKKNPNKQRKSFFWRRKPLQPARAGKPVNGYEELSARRVRGIARRC
jgi:hypothetical protein